MPVIALCPLSRSTTKAYGELGPTDAYGQDRHPGFGTPQVILGTRGLEE